MRVGLPCPVRASDHHCGIRGQGGPSPACQWCGFTRALAHPSPREDDGLLPGMGWSRADHGPGAPLRRLSLPLGHHSHTAPIPGQPSETPMAELWDFEQRTWAVGCTSSHCSWGVASPNFL